MINKRILELVLTDQKEEAQIRLNQEMIVRDEEKLVNLESDMAQVIMGVRRCGKSTLCFSVLKKAEVKFGYVNFDDERLIGGTPEDLNNILEVLFKINGDFNYLFLDEVQNIEGWHLFVNRLLRRGMKLLITGSNARLLNHDLATHLTGRYESIEIFPFSFKEYCCYLKLDVEKTTTNNTALLRDAFDKFLKFGGFPEIIKGASPRRYISNLTNNILKRDIRQRYKLRYFASFERLAYHLLNIVPFVFSSVELSTLFGIKSIQTTRNYVEYLEEAYLIQSVRKFSYKSRLRLSGEKLYPIDVALMDNRTDAFSTLNLGWRLETVVFLELKRKTLLTGENVFYYKKDSRSKECDFVVCQGNQAIQLYQVAYDISNPKTLKREVESLIELSILTGCEKLYLITDFDSRILEINNKTIEIIPAYEWMSRR